MGYPADVQAVLDHAAERGWTLERYQAALSIALAHLETAEVPEVVVQWAEERIDFVAPDYRGEPAAAHLDADTVYLVCPVCCQRTAAYWVADAFEAAPVSLELEADGTLVAWRSDYDVSQDDRSVFVCQNRGCHTELSVPAWLTFDD